MSGALWQIWWAWVVLGFALATLEVFLPGYIFLGFAGGAVATGLLVALGLGGLGLGFTLFVFALLSLGAWLAMRALLGTRKGQVKIWDRDINED